MKSFNRCIFFLSVTMLLFSCSVKRMAMNQIAGMIETGITAFEHDDDMEMLKEAFPPNIKLFEALLANDPENPRLLVLLSQLYGCYAFAFFEGELEDLSLISDLNPEQQKTVTLLEINVNKYYTKGINYAMRALEARHKGFERNIKNITTADRCIGSISKKDVPALFWYAFNLGAYINQNRTALAAVSNGFVVEKGMRRILELDPSFFYGGAHLFLLSYESRAPILGGNHKTALHHYNELKKIAGNDFLMADFFYAKFYLYQLQKRTEFETVLNHIINYQDVDGRYPLFNEVARIRSRTCLARMDQLFE